MTQRLYYFYATKGGREYSKRDSNSSARDAGRAGFVAVPKRDARRDESSAYWSQFNAFIGVLTTLVHSWGHIPAQKWVYFTLLAIFQV